MDTIRSYVESLFAAYAKTSQLQAAKEEILANMLEKYEEMKAQGCSENEAIGTVIVEFGNIDELVVELGFETTEAADKLEPSRPELTFLEMEEYLLARKRGAWQIGGGMALCIVSPILFLLTQSATIGLIGVFGCLAVAVLLFILGAFHLLSKSPLILHELRDPQLYTALIERQQRQFAIGVSGGIALDFVGMAAYCVAYSCDGYFVPNCIAPSLLLLFLGVGTLFVTATCIRYSGFKRLLARKAAEKKLRRSKLFDIMAAVWVVLTLFIFLFFCGDYGMIDFAWLVWPVSAILYGFVLLVGWLFLKEGRSLKKALVELGEDEETP